MGFMAIGGPALFFANGHQEIDEAIKYGVETPLGFIGWSVLTLLFVGFFAVSSYHLLRYALRGY
jgi:hypothetical protein